MDPDPSMIPVTLARMEGKLDRFGDRLADLVSDRADHEVRLRSLESRAVVTPRGLATTLTVVGSIAGSVAAVLALLVG